MLQQVYDDREMKNSQVYDWHKHFYDGHESVDSDLCSGRPSVSSNEANVERMWEIVRSGERKSVDQIASESGISMESCHIILHDMSNMCRICQHLLPWMLMWGKGGGMRMNIFGALIDVTDEDNKSRNNIITRNETWCFLYSPQNNTLLNGNHYHHLKARNFESIGVTERLCWVFFLKGLFHYEFISECKTVNKEMYIDFLCHLGVAVRRKLPEKWRMHGGCLFTAMPQHTLRLWSRIS
jgi:hypothetical protein